MKIEEKGKSKSMPRNNHRQVLNRSLKVRDSPSFLHSYPWIERLFELLELLLLQEVWDLVLVLVYPVVLLSNNSLTYYITYSGL